MRQVIALVVALALMVGAATPAAYAGTGTNVALGLASFAVFNQLVGPLFHRRPPVREVVVERPVYHVVERPVYHQVYAPPSQVVVVQPSPAYPTVVQYSTGATASTPPISGSGFPTRTHFLPRRHLRPRRKSALARGRGSEE